MPDLTAHEFAALHGIGPHTVRFQAMKGKFGPGGAYQNKPGGRWRITEAGQERYVADRLGKHGPCKGSRRQRQAPVDSTTVEPQAPTVVERQPTEAEVIAYFNSLPGGPDGS